MKLGKLDDAFNSFKSLSENNPKDPRCRIGLAYCSYHLDKPRGAIQYYLDAKKIDASDWYVIAASCQLPLDGIQADPRSRVAAVTNIINSWPGDIVWYPMTIDDLYLARGQSRAERSRYAEARTDLLLAASLNKEARHQSVCYYEQVHCLLRCGNYKLAQFTASVAIKALESSRTDRYVNEHVSQLSLINRVMAGELWTAAKIAVENSEKQDATIDSFQQAIQYLILAGKHEAARKLIDKVEVQFGKEFESIAICKAYLLSASTEEKIRDGKLAMQLTNAFETEYVDNARMLMVRAIALAEASKFDQAIKVGSRAAGLLEEKCPCREEYERRVRLFKTGKPFRVDIDRPDLDLIGPP